MQTNPPFPVSVAFPEVYYTTPLVAKLQQRLDLTLHPLAPAQLDASALQQHGCVLLSPAALLAVSEIRLLPGMGVSAHGATGTERLLSSAPLEEIVDVQVHPDAAHLLPLLELLYLARDLTPPTPVPYDAGATAPLLCSGDVGRALGDREGHDLGELWHALTELPLVLGVWACAPGAPYRMLRTVLATAAREGTVEEDGDAGLLHHELLSRESDSIRAFHTLAVSHGRAEASSEAIVFC